MPLVRISIDASARPETRKAVASAVYEAMRTTIGIPEGDRFILFSAHGAADWIIDSQFPNVERSKQFVLIQITLSRGRSVEQKQDLYAQISQCLESPAGISPDDVMIVLTENNLEDWSFGKGEANYVLNPPAWARKAAEGNA